MSVYKTRILVKVKKSVARLYVYAVVKWPGQAGRGSGEASMGGEFGTF